MLTVMVSDLEDYRLKFVYLLPAGGRQVGQHCEGNSLIKPRSHCADLEEPDLYDLKNRGERHGRSLFRRSFNPTFL